MRILTTLVTGHGLSRLLVYGILGTTCAFARGHKVWRLVTALRSSFVKNLLSPGIERFLFFRSQEVVLIPFASMLPLLVSSLFESSLVATIGVRALLKSVSLEAFKFSSILSDRLS